MITVKEEFLAGAKAQRAIALGGSDTIVMWLAMKGYAATHPTDGFIPDEDIERLPGAPKHPRKILKHLVDCGALQRDGTRGSGLVDQAPGGWELHDYLDHATSSLEVEQRREKERTRKAIERLQKVVAKLANVPLSAVRDHYGDLGLVDLESVRSEVEADPLSFGRPRTVLRTESGHVRGQSSGRPGAPSRVGAPARAPAPDASAPPRALPSPAQPSADGSNTSQPVPDVPGQSAVPDGLAGRIIERGTEPDGTPKPRHDPLGERLAFGQWYPSDTLLAWMAAIGLTDRGVDEVLIDVRNKITGRGDLGWWDKHVRSFAEAAARRSVVLKAPPEDPAAAARRAKLAADHEARLARLEREGIEAAARGDGATLAAAAALEALAGEAAAEDRKAASQ